MMNNKLTHLIITIIPYYHNKNNYKNNNKTFRMQNFNKIQKVKILLKI